MRLEDVYQAYLEEVITPLVSKEYERDIDFDTTVWTEETLGFFYKLGKKQGYYVDTNSKTVGAIDPDGYMKYTQTYLEPPKEYLVDLCWRNWDESTGKYWLELALELEWQPTAPGGYGDEDMDEDVYKLLDVDARKRVGILGCTAREKKHLSRDSAEKLIENFQGYVKTGDFHDAEFLFVFIDEDDSEDHFGVGARLVDSNGNGSDLPGYPYRKLR
ncbi:MAG: hypothetical protein E3J35_09265 [Methanomassiliicoccales archaeon]|nr:MAG: hypothetical protein E3J35_09265 [Methanomassiliicoccales archaeon]